MSPFIRISKYENTIIKDGENDKYGYTEKAEKTGKTVTPGKTEKTEKAGKSGKTGKTE